MKKFFPPLIWALIIGIMALYPKNDMPKVEIFGVANLDKVGHIVMYFILTWLMLRSVQKMKDLNNLHISVVFLVAGLYGLMLEILQHSMNLGRAFEILDIIANISGVIFGIFLFKFLIKT